MVKELSFKRRLLMIISFIVIILALALSIGFIKNKSYADPASYAQQIENMSTIFDEQNTQNTLLLSDIKSLADLGYLTPESFKIVKYSLENCSIDADSYKTFTLTTDASANTLNNYEPKGITGFDFSNSASGGTGATFCYFYRLYTDPDDPRSGVNAYVRNSNDSAAKVDITANVLYVKKPVSE